MPTTAIQAFIDAQNQNYEMTADVIQVAQKEVFAKDGTPLYLLPSYGWDGGSGFSIEYHNLQQYASIDVMGGPGAELYSKIDKSQPAGAYYNYEGDSEAQVFIFP